MLAKSITQNVKKGKMILMKKKTAILALLVAVTMAGTLLFTGCGDSQPVEEEDPIITLNTITGEEFEEGLPARPVQVSIDNVGAAVPQSNISHADIVYEFPVEGEQTRLQAIFYSDIPEFFGPIRSVRPYFVDLADMYDTVFVAHGWSNAAKKKLQNGERPYINAMENEVDFYRVSDKPAPHNSYIEWETVKATIDEKGWWDEDNNIRGFKFMEKGKTNETAEECESVSFVYKGNACEFTYDPETELYTRTVKGAPYIDKETGENITVSNVLVQKITSEVLDEKGRLSIDMMQGGYAYLFTKGTVVKGTWNQKNLHNTTIFKDSNDKQFRLSKGKSWVEVMDQTCTMTY